MSSRPRFRTAILRKLAANRDAADLHDEAFSLEGALIPPSDPGAFGGLLAGVSFIGGVAGATVFSDAPYPRPGSSPAEIRRYFRGNPGAARISVVGQLISAASLVRFTATVANLSGRSDRGARGLRAAAIAGGGLAAASLAASALCAAALTGGPGKQDASAAALHRLMFAAGGPVHGASFGMLVGALGLAGLRTGELPRPLAISGLASAVAGVLSPLYFVWKPAAWFIPAGRFSGLLVSGIVGTRLGRRQDRRPPSEVEAPWGRRLSGFEVFAEARTREIIFCKPL